MPNGVDKNWVRFCAAVDGFFLEFGPWPTRVRAFPVALDDLRSLFRNESFDRITAKLELVPGGSLFVAEDDAYSYGDRGFPASRPRPRAEEWLGVHPDAAESQTSA
jgi:hypothetical protein